MKKVTIKYFIFLILGIISVKTSTVIHQQLPQQIQYMPGQIQSNTVLQPQPQRQPQRQPQNSNILYGAMNIAGKALTGATNFAGEIIQDNRDELRNILTSKLLGRPAHIMYHHNQFSGGYYPGFTSQTPPINNNLLYNPHHQIYNQPGYGTTVGNPSYIQPNPPQEYYFSDPPVPIIKDSLADSMENRNGLFKYPQIFLTNPGQELPPPKSYIPVPPANSFFPHI